MVQHDEVCPPGLLGDWAAARGVGVALHRAPETLPDPAAFDFLVLLGARASAYDEAVVGSWLEPELATLRAALAAGVPVLGICFGAQALALAGGGSVGPAPRSELAWTVLDTDEPDEVLAGPWLSWHDDAFSVPPGARRLARSAAGPQAFALGSSLGVQFHPEAGPDLVERWLGFSGPALERLGLDAGRVRADTERLAAGAKGRAYRLFDRFLAGVRRRPTTAAATPVPSAR